MRADADANTEISKWPCSNIIVVINNKSSHRKCSGKKSVPKNFANLIEKHLCWILFLIKLQVFRLKQ